MKVEEIFVTLKEMCDIRLTNMFFQGKYRNLKLGDLHFFLQWSLDEETRNKNISEKWVINFYNAIRYLFKDDKIAVREENAEPFVAGNCLSIGKNGFIDSFTFYNIKSGYRGVIFFDNGFPVESRELIRGELKTVIKIK